MNIVHNKTDIQSELKRIENRINLENNEEVNTIVKKILEDVKNQGDEALKKYTLKFDGFNPEPLRISKKEIETAWETTTKPLQEALKNAKHRIEKFHEKEIPESFSIKGINGENIQRKATSSISSEKFSKIR